MWRSRKRRGEWGPGGGGPDGDRERGRAEGLCQSGIFLKETKPLVENKILVQRNERREEEQIHERDEPTRREMSPPGMSEEAEEGNIRATWVTHEMIPFYVTSYHWGLL